MWFDFLQICCGVNFFRRCGSLLLEEVCCVNPNQYGKDLNLIQSKKIGLDVPWRRIWSKIYSTTKIYMKGVILDVLVQHVEHDIPACMLQILVFVNRLMFLVLVLNTMLWCNMWNTTFHVNVVLLLNLFVYTILCFSNLT